MCVDDIDFVCESKVSPAKSDPILHYYFVIMYLMIPLWSTYTKIKTE